MSSSGGVKLELLLLGIMKCFSQLFALAVKEDKAAIALQLFRNRGPADHSDICIIQTRTNPSPESRWFCPAAFVAIENRALVVASAECVLHGWKTTSGGSISMTLNAFMWCNEMQLNFRNYPFQVSSAGKPLMEPLQIDPSPEGVNRANLVFIRVTEEMIQEGGVKELNWTYQDLMTNFTNVASPRAYGTLCRYVDLIEDHFNAKKRYVFPLLWMGMRKAKIAESKYCAENWNAIQRPQMLCFVPEDVQAQEDTLVDHLLETLLCQLGRTPENCPNIPPNGFEYSARRLYYCPFNCKAVANKEVCEWIISGVGRYHKRGMRGDLSVSLREFWKDALWTASEPDNLAAAFQPTESDPLNLNPQILPEDNSDIDAVIHDAIGPCMLDDNLTEERGRLARAYYCNFESSSAVRKVTPEFKRMALETFKFNDCVKQSVRERNEPFDVMTNLENGDKVLPAIINHLCDNSANPVKLRTQWQQFASSHLIETTSASTAANAASSNGQLQKRRKKLPMNRKLSHAILSSTLKKASVRRKQSTYQAKPPENPWFPGLSPSTSFNSKGKRQRPKSQPTVNARKTVGRDPLGRILRSGKGSVGIKAEDNQKRSSKDDQTQTEWPSAEGLTLAKLDSTLPAGSNQKFLCPINNPVCYGKLILSPLLLARNAFNCSRSKACLQELLDSSKHFDGTNHKPGRGEEQADEQDTQTTTDHSDAGYSGEMPQDSSDTDYIE